MDFSSTDDDLRDAMAWHTPKRGVAWRGMPCRAIPYLPAPIHRLDDGSRRIQDSIRDRPKQTPLNGLFLSHLASTHLVTPRLIR